MGTRGYIVVGLYLSALIIDLHPVITFVWKDDFSKQARDIVFSLEEWPEENNLLLSYASDTSAVDAIACSKTQEMFVQRLKTYSHPFLDAAFKNHALFEALIILRGNRECVPTPNVVALVIMKAFERKEDDFVAYLDTKISHLEYLAFEAALLLQDQHLEKACLKKGVKLDEAFYGQGGPTLMDLVRKKKCSYMRERILRIIESSISYKKNDQAPLNVITERLKKMLAENKKGCA